MNKLQQIEFIDQLKEICVEAADDADQVLAITMKCDNLKWYDFTPEQLIQMVQGYASELKINVSEYKLNKCK